MIRRNLTLEVDSLLLRDIATHLCIYIPQSKLGLEGLKESTRVGGMSVRGSEED